MVYLVTWDLNKEGAAYSQARERLLESLKTFSVNYTSSLDSVRFVATTKTADQLYRHIKSYTDDNDIVMVTKLLSGTDNHQGNLGKELWAWINTRI